MKQNLADFQMKELYIKITKNMHLNWKLFTKQSIWCGWINNESWLENWFSKINVVLLCCSIFKSVLSLCAWKQKQTESILFWKLNNLAKPRWSLKTSSLVSMGYRTTRNFSQKVGNIIWFGAIMTFLDPHLLLRVSWRHQHAPVWRRRRCTRSRCRPCVWPMPRSAQN